MFISDFIRRFVSPEQGEAHPRVQILPLPCPVHGTAFIPEAKGNGEFGFYCPLCRLACQPQVITTEPLAFQQAQEGQQKPLRPGYRAAADAKKRRFQDYLERKRNGRLVLLFNGNSCPDDTDVLRFARLETEVEFPKIKKDLPNVG